MVFEQITLFVHALGPLFLMMALGWFSYRIKMVGDGFVSGLNRLVFTYCLPAAIFMSIFQANLSEAFDFGMVSFFTIATALSCVIVWAYGKRALHSTQVASFVQASCRSNYVVLALPALLMMLPYDYWPQASLMAPLVVAINSILAAVLFTLGKKRAEKISLWATILEIAMGTLKTPMVLAVFIGAIFNLLSIPVGVVGERTIGAFADMSAPAALFACGTALSIQKAKRHLRPALTAMLFKNVLIPAGFVLFALLLGFRGSQLLILTMIGLSPTATTAYATAAQMGGDPELTASCVAATNAGGMIFIAPTLVLLGTLGLL